MNKDLIVKYILEEISDEEKIMVEEWLVQDLDHQKEYFELKRTWTISKVMKRDVKEIDVDLAWDTFLKNKAKITRNAPLIRLRNWRKITSIAASIAIVLFMVGSWFLYTSKSSYVELVSGNEFIKSTLPDGSTVNLNRNASLTFDKQWMVNTRNVLLKHGEVFFDVKRDEKVPFIITSGKSKITVLGTSFHVSREKNTTSVIVASGSVKVSFENQEVVLFPKESVSISDSDPQKIRIDTLKDELYKYYITHEFIFENTPLKRVFEVLGRAYDKTIILEDPRKGELLYTTTFKQQSFNEMMNIILQTFELKMEKRNNSYHIK